MQSHLLVWDSVSNGVGNVDGKIWTSKQVKGGLNGTVTCRRGGGGPLPWFLSSRVETGFGYISIGFFSS